MQDELIYNQILGRDSAILGNDENENKKIIGAEFDKYKRSYESLSDEEKKEFEENIYPEFEKYMSKIIDKTYAKYEKPYENLSDKEKEEATENIHSECYAIYKVQQLTNDDIDRIRETRDLSEAIKSTYKNFSIEELTPEQQEKFKEIILGDKSNYVTASTETEEQSIRVALFGKESWKDIIKDRNVDDLKNIYNEVKENSEEKKENKTQENNERE